MTTRLVVVGTDTGVGKTVFTAGLVAALDGCYWKPIQAGMDDGTDTDDVRRLSGLPADRFLPERYRLRTPCSPHRSAEIDGIVIDVHRLQPPECNRPLIIEAAGGVLVPLTRTVLQADVIASWNLPVILVARTELGTINHSLLSLEALRQREIPVHGVAFVGDGDEPAEQAIIAFGRTRRLGHLRRVAPLDKVGLHKAFAEAFRTEDFRS